MIDGLCSSENAEILKLAVFAHVAIVNDVVDVVFHGDLVISDNGQRTQ